MTYLWAIARRRSAACEMGTSELLGIGVGRGDATAFDVEVAIVGDWRLDIGCGDIRLGPES